MEPNRISLSSSQQAAYDYALSLAATRPLTGVVDGHSRGLSTILRQLAIELNAGFLRMADFFDHMEPKDAFKIEEAIVEMLARAMEEKDIVVVDDFSGFVGILSNCYYKARPSVLDHGLDTIHRLLEKGQKKLVLGLSYHLDSPLNEICSYVHFPRLTAEDFRFLFGAMAGDKVAGIDFVQIHRFVPNFTLPQIRYVSSLIAPFDPMDTEAFQRFLEEHALASNVDTEEVEEVSFDSLRGVEEVIRQLDIDLIVPMERPDLMAELGLQPKRGVLLYGPPGTGKTTIGRALAHRLRSKFFLIDGTVISGTGDFYGTVARIFQKAKQNAPSILFIDDCDVLFENENEMGLYRYLLTLLDGLESKGNSRVTILMTAMNIGSLPPALIRSGRVELWLEMKLPDAEARVEIMQSLLKSRPAALRNVNLSALADLTDGLTGADLRRVVSDGVNLYGYDIAREQPLQQAQHYFEKAVAQLRHHRQQLEQAPHFTAAHHGVAAKLQQKLHQMIAE